MPSLSPLTLTDRQPTPVSHTFVPQSLTGGVATFVETDGSPINDNIITVSTRRSNGKIKVRLKINIPTVVDETINGVVVPKVIRNAYADATFTFDQSSTVQERDDLVSLFKNLQGSASPAGDNTFQRDVVVHLEGIYG